MDEEGAAEGPAEIRPDDGRLTNGRIEFTMRNRSTTDERAFDYDKC